MDIIKTRKPAKGKSKPRSTSQARSRAGLLPGQSRKRSTVYVERLRGAEEAHRYSPDEMTITDVYYVETLRTDNHWQHRIDRGGDTFVIPGKVAERIVSQREAIVKEARSDRSREAAEVRKASRVETEVEDVVAEAERRQDLEGF